MGRGERSHTVVAAARLTHSFRRPQAAVPRPSASLRWPTTLNPVPFGPCRPPEPIVGGAEPVMPVWEALPAARGELDTIPPPTVRPTPRCSTDGPPAPHTQTTPNRPSTSGSLCAGRAPFTMPYGPSTVAG